MSSPLFSFEMIHLQPSSTEYGNDVYVTPFEARKFLPSFTKYLMVLTNVATKRDIPFIAKVLVDNERYTYFRLATNLSDGVNGSVFIPNSGLYTYAIYGQNSTTNLDHTDASVVGICEVGSCKVSDEAAWTIPAIDIPDNVIYYE